MKARWADEAWADYLRWRGENRPVFTRINRLVKAIESDPFRGIGKPEPLRHELAGCWSRRITEEHRLVYQVTGGQIHVISCRYHYRR
ncbi:MAG: Txe/YoeB family addiction module toxin [Pseudomonadota bacterium]